MQCLLSLSFRNIFWLLCVFPTIDNILLLLDPESRQSGFQVISVVIGQSELLALHDYTPSRETNCLTHSVSSFLYPNLLSLRVSIHFRVGYQCLSYRYFSICPSSLPLPLTGILEQQMWVLIEFFCLKERILWLSLMQTVSLLLTFLLLNTFSRLHTISLLQTLSPASLQSILLSRMLFLGSIWPIY